MTFKSETSTQDTFDWDTLNGRESCEMFPFSCGEWTVLATLSCQVTTFYEESKRRFTVVVANFMIVLKCPRLKQPSDWLFKRRNASTSTISFPEAIPKTMSRFG